MAGKNKFGFDALETKAAMPRRRSPGPMGMAVREAAASLQESTDAKVEQRRANASDAKEYRAALADGRVLVTLALGDIATDDLPRDRLELDAVAASDEMDELMTSIRSRGQREPIEVYQVGEAYQLKKGWRRLTALRRLYDETGDEAFNGVVARIALDDAERLALYIDMVEENVIREDLTFAEMAQLAITAAADGAVEGATGEAMVGKLYGSLHKMKRSYIRSFVFLLEELGEALRWPKEVSRNLGVDVARRLKVADKAALLTALEGCKDGEAQGKVLAAFLVDKPKAPAKPAPMVVGRAKITASKGACRIADGRDYTKVSAERMEAAVRAFQQALDG